MTQTTRLLAALALALSVPLAPAARAQDMPCRAEIRTFVENVGIIFDEMSDTQLTTQFWGESGEGRQVSGYWFFGRPAACPTGGIRVSLWANCEISDAFTIGGCSIPNVPSQNL